MRKGPPHISYSDFIFNLFRYYIDSSRNPTLNNTIVLVGVNNGYVDFFHNFKCYMDRLGIKFLPLSMDKGVYSYLTDNQVFQFMFRCLNYI